MNERREPVISGIRPERDEIARHQQKTNGPTGGGGRPPPARPPVLVKSRLAPFALLFAFAGIGLAGFAYWQLTLAQKELVSSEARIVEIEDRLRAMDDASNASLSTLKESSKENFSEIDKLWATRNVNKKAIADNADEIAKVGKSVQGVQAKINTIVADAKLANELVEAQQGAMDSIDRKYTDQLAKIQQLQDKVTELEAVKTEYQRRIQNLEQAIEANDAFRRQVTQDLLKLKGQ